MAGSTSILRWAALCLLVCALARAGAAGSGASRPGDPPRIASRNPYEYRHLQLFNREYLKWVGDNIHSLEYDVAAGAYQVRWQTVAQTAATGQPAVVMVTQSTISRLRAFQLVVREWNGPVALSIFVELPAPSPHATACRERISAWIREHIVEAWPRGAAAAPPLSVSYLHARAAEPGASCELPVPLTREETGDSTLGSFARTGVLQARAVLLGSQAAAHAAGVHRADDTDALGGDQHGSDVTTWRGVDGFSGRVLAAAQRRPMRRSKSPVQPGYWKPAPAGWKPVWHARPHTTRFNMPYPKPTAKPWRELYDSFYPVNTLRNLAWSQVPSGVFVFLNDVDFITTPKLHADLTSGRWAAELQRMREAWTSTGKRMALVLPAFERLKATKQASPGGRPAAVPFKGACSAATGCAWLQGMALPRTFDSLRTMMQQGAVDVFHRRSAALGHSCYSWLSWFQDAAPEELLEMEYRHPCEPYVIALSDALPRYDERFRGRGQNKIEQLTHMAMWGFEWRLLPAHFVLHVPHESSAPQQGGWDVDAMPLALMKVKMREVEREPQFCHYVQQNIPIRLVH